EVEGHGVWVGHVVILPHARSRATDVTPVTERAPGGTECREGSPKLALRDIVLAPTRLAGRLPGITGVTSRTASPPPARTVDPPDAPPEPPRADPRSSSPHPPPLPHQDFQPRQSQRPFSPHHTHAARPSVTHITRSRLMSDFVPG